jgi:DNA-binding NarL/FixJ family response regulator
MNPPSIAKLVNGTADPAFAIDSLGLISAWNQAAVELFGLDAREAIGGPCHEILKGTDEGGVSCSERCAIKQALEANRPVRNFDLQIETRMGRQWSNISILIVADPASASRHAIHIVHPREMRKRLEIMMRDFIVRETELTRDVAARVLSSVRIATNNVKLTARETEILQLLARGNNTKAIAEALSISGKTTSNHISKILVKLDAHTRLEAVQRAQRAGFI